MKSSFLYTVIVLSLFATPAQAQKWDNVWLMGYYYYSHINLIPGLDFYYNQPDTVGFYTPFEMWGANAGICDDDGVLLMYTNGIYLANRYHQLMEGSADFNLDSAVAYYGSQDFNIPQSAIVLPFPGHPGAYYLFHVSGRMFNNFEDLQPFRLAYSIIDMTANNGAGKMTLKAATAVDDTLLYCTMQAVKHANGRDWWVVIGEYNSNRFYTLLLDPQGVHPAVNQAVAPFIGRGLYYSQSVFSPDGSQFALTRNDSSLVYLWNFDRCKGEFSFREVLPFAFDTLGDNTTGCSFSPNSRYLFVNTYTELYQFDTWAVDVNSSRQLIDTYDGFTDPFPTYFYRHRLGPDGRIYIVPPGGHRYVHVIRQPDQPGIACDFAQHALKLILYNGGSIPEFPHFRTATSTGSICDTIITGIEEQTVLPAELSIVPNPASKETIITIVTDENEIVGWVVQITDMTGRVMAVADVTANTPHQVNLSGWAAGMYVVEIWNKNTRIVQKLLIF